MVAESMQKLLELEATPVKDVVSLLEAAVQDRDEGDGAASLLQLALVAISELLMGTEQDQVTLGDVLHSFQYAWASTALHDMYTSDYSPALQQVVERLNVS
jgi:hypothetical protein